MTCRIGRRKRRRIGNEAGLTLLEICLTLLILGLIVAFASPRLSRAYRHSQLRNQAERLGDDLRLIKARAVLAAQKWRLVVWPDGRGYTIEQQNRQPKEASFFGVDEISECVGQVVRHQPLSHGLMIAPPGAVWQWQPDGTAVGDSLYLIDEEGRTYEIRVNGKRLVVQEAETFLP